MMHRRGVWVAFFGLLLGALPVLAHHSVEAEFFQDKTWTQTGVLTKVDWINPHSITWITVKDEATGKEERVGCQGNPPTTYSRAGLVKSDWKIGEVVSITCLAAKDGSKNWGFIKSLKYHSDGHVIVFRVGAV